MSKKNNAPVEKNRDIELEILSLGSKGEGIGRFEGFAIFVPGALPGERILAHIVQVKSGYAFGKLLRILEASPDRIEPRCPQAGKCGGCQLSHLSYEAQLRYKREKIGDVLKRIGRFEGVELPPVLGMTDPLHYRNKAAYPVACTADGPVTAGFYATHSHRILPADDCYLQKETANRLLPLIRGKACELMLPAYDEETHTGLLRHILIRSAEKTDECSVCFVLNGKKLPAADAWCRFFEEQGVTSFSINLNREKGNTILGSETVTLFGKPQITDELDGLLFEISPVSFYQVNPLQTEVLYRTALEFADLRGDETVIDAYCGIGTISLFLARRAGKVYGIEIVPEAIENARRNAERNGIRNAEFFVGASEDEMPKLVEQGVRPDVVVVDPPRSGCDRKLLESICKVMPEKLVYVSCDPATLARDLDILCHEFGAYTLEKVQGVDMFPMTSHVETVVCLRRAD